MSDLQKKWVVKGVVWSAIERFSVQGIQFVLGIFIARLVAPSEYGLIAMLGIFLAIAQGFIDSGFANALIQKQNRTETDYSTVFYFNIAVAIILYGLLYFAAPYIASFYREPLLEVVTKWVGLNIIISSFSIVQRAWLSVQMDFKTQAKASLVAVILSGLVGVYLAYHGYGVWALVTQALLNNLLDTLLLWGYAKWRPALVFSYLSFKELFAFGSKQMLSGFMQVLYMNLYSLVIGRRYSASDVGFYNISYSLAQYPSTNIVNIITRAIYPVQCSMQDDDEKLSATFHQYLRMSCFIVFPLMIGLAVLARPLILLVLTEKWMPAANLLSILSIAYMWVPVMVINNQILNVKGRTDYFLKAEIIKKILALAILFATMPLGLTILCIGQLLYSFVDIAIILFYAKKVVVTGYWMQVKQLLPVFLLSSSMGVLVWVVSSVCPSALLQLLAGVLVGAGYYIIASKCFHFKEFDFLLSILKR